MSQALVRRLFLGLAAGSLSLIATAAAAHAHLTASNPPANAAVAAPRTLSLSFSEALEPKFSGLTLAGPGGAPVTLSVSASDDRKSLLATPTRPLAAGAYKVVWHAVARDGHRMEGAYAFTVR